MPRPRLPWVKVWCDMLADPKMLQLTIGERGCFVMMMLAAQGSPVRGALAMTATRPMTTEEIADTIALKNGDMETLKSAINKLIDFGCLEYTPDKLLKITHFMDRQNIYESDFKDYHSTKMASIRKFRKTPDKLLKAPDKLRPEVRGKRKDVREVPPLVPPKGDTKTAHGVFNNVMLSEEEYQKLVAQFGEGDAKDRIDRLSEYISSKGKKYASHYATILAWARGDRKNGSARVAPIFPPDPEYPEKKV